MTGLKGPLDPVRWPNLTGDPADDRKLIEEYQKRTSAMVHRIIGYATSIRSAAVYYACLGTPASVQTAMKAMCCYADLRECVEYARSKEHGIRDKLGTSLTLLTSKLDDSSIRRLAASISRAQRRANYVINFFASLRADGTVVDPPDRGKPLLEDDRDPADDEWLYRKLPAELTHLVEANLRQADEEFDAVLPEALPLHKL